MNTVLRGGVGGHGMGDMLKHRGAWGGACCRGMGRGWGILGAGSIVCRAGLEKLQAPGFQAGRDFAGKRHSRCGQRKSCWLRHSCMMAFRRAA